MKKRLLIIIQILNGHVQLMIGISVLLVLIFSFNNCGKTGAVAEGSSSVHKSPAGETGPILMSAQITVDDLSDELKAQTNKCTLMADGEGGTRYLILQTQTIDGADPDNAITFGFAFPLAGVQTAIDEGGSQSLASSIDFRMSGNISMTSTLYAESFININITKSQPQNFFTSQCDLTVTGKDVADDGKVQIAIQCTDLRLFALTGDILPTEKGIAFALSFSCPEVVDDEDSASPKREIPIAP